MFERICERLPGYSEYHDRIVARHKNPSLPMSTPDSPSSLRRGRIVKTLSYIYADIIEFCQDACKIFATKRHGVRYKATAIADMFWRPFDVRYATILDRLQSHQELFRQEMQLEESLYMEQNQLKGLKELRKLRETIIQLEKFITFKFEGLEDKQPLASPVSNTPESLLLKIKTWINSPDYMRQYEKAQSLRLNGTGSWFTDSECYKTFKSFENICTDDDSEGILSLDARRILLVRGKPGYGKTVLSQILIDDLKLKYETSRSTDISRRQVLFYHFDSERLDYCTLAHAIRAVFHQLVHINRSDQDVLDSLSILIDSESSGQIFGSDEDLRQALYLLLMRIGGAVLVFDGIDECSSSNLLLQMIHDLCHDTGTKALLLSRPTLTLPRNFKCFVPLDLEYWQNAEDIRTFLTPEIGYLHADGWLGEDAGCDEICSILTAKSQSMFLWAHLMIKYLNCEVLSPSERIEAIFAEEVVEGLEKVYKRTLHALGRTFATERAKVRRMFQLMCVAERPFKVSELQTILAVTPGQVTHSSDLIVSFPNVLPKMSGGLVEVDKQGSVVFIHSSFREFMTSPTHRGRNDFAVNVNEAHLSASTLCLSYLIYDSPQGPFSGSRLPIAEALISLQREFPLAIYAANSWVYHGRLGVARANVFRDNPLAEHEPQFYSMLSILLNQRRSVTTWIETSWLSGKSPSVRSLVNELDNAPQLYSSDTRGMGVVRPGIFGDLEEFSKDLELLNSEWSHELQEYPAAIWGSSITAFNKSLFWYQTTGIPSGKISSTG